jgi:hypothetical protein
MVRRHRLKGAGLIMIKIMPAAVRVANSCNGIKTIEK